jgi:hypothetical protein
MSEPPAWANSIDSAILTVVCSAAKILDTDDQLASEMLNHPQRGGQSSNQKCPFAAIPEFKVVALSLESLPIVINPWYRHMHLAKQVVVVGWVLIVDSELKFESR